METLPIKSHRKLVGFCYGALLVFCLFVVICGIINFNWVQFLIQEFNLLFK